MTTLIIVYLIGAYLGGYVAYRINKKESMTGIAGIPAVLMGTVFWWVFLVILLIQISYGQLDKQVERIIKNRRRKTGAEGRPGVEKKPP